MRLVDIMSELWRSKPSGASLENFRARKELATKGFGFEETGKLQLRSACTDSYQVVQKPRKRTRGVMDAVCSDEVRPNP